MAKRLDVLCVGAILLDILMRTVPTDHMTGDCCYVQDMAQMGGGDANNGAIDMARMGLKTGIIVNMGKDSAAGFLLARLREAGVDTRWVMQSDAYPTSVDVLCIDEHGERHGINFSRQMDLMRAACIPDAALAAARCMHVTNTNELHNMLGEDLAALFARARAHGCITSMDVNTDMAHLTMENLGAALHACDIFIPSHYEVEHLTGLSDPLALREYFRPFGMRVFGVKLGARGVYVTDFQEDVFCPSLYHKPDPPVDTTGAGDAFFSGFLAGYLAGMPLADCAVAGSACAALCIEQMGATAWARPFADVLAFAAQSGRPLRCGK
nr:carbohydrate kinase family protein [Maliibacterium massiliense]